MSHRALTNRPPRPLRTRRERAPHSAILRTVAAIAHMVLLLSQAGLTQFAALAGSRILHQQVPVRERRAEDALPLRIRQDRQGLSLWGTAPVSCTGPPELFLILGRLFVAETRGEKASAAVQRLGGRGGRLDLPCPCHATPQQLTNVLLQAGSEKLESQINARGMSELKRLLTICDLDIGAPQHMSMH